MHRFGLIALLLAACTRQDMATTRPVDIGVVAEAAPVCTSGRFWNDGDEGSSKMHPGRACIACHESGGGGAHGGGDDDDHEEGGDDGPKLVVAGTVYPTKHEPDDCYGTTNAVVDITDANGVEYKLSVNASGNFLLKQKDAPGFTMPFYAAVERNGVVNVMKASQTSGDCNGCHTQMGDNEAPGRILVK